MSMDSRNDTYCSLLFTHTFKCPQKCRFIGFEVKLPICLHTRFCIPHPLDQDVPIPTPQISPMGGGRRIRLQLTQDEQAMEFVPNYSQCSGKSLSLQMTFNSCLVFPDIFCLQGKGRKEIKTLQLLDSCLPNAPPPPILKACYWPELQLGPNCKILGIYILTSTVPIPLSLSCKAKLTALLMAAPSPWIQTSC